MMTKSRARELYRQRRSDLSMAEVAAGSKCISDLLFTFFDFRQLRVVSTFITISRHNELDTGLIAERLWREFPDVETVAPVSDLENGSIECVPFRKDAVLAENRWGIREPVGKPIDPVEIDLVLVPLLAFDQRGHRVGYGRGFYDRFLAKCRPDCQKVGLSFFGPTSELIEADQHDIPLDACVTPTKTYRF